MSWRSLKGSQDRLRDSEDRFREEYAAVLAGAAQAGLAPDPPVVCPECHGQVPPREPRCPHCGHDFAAMTPEVAEHVRVQKLVELGFGAWLRHWSRVLAIAALIALAMQHAPGEVLVALGILVLLSPGLLCLAVIPLDGRRSGTFCL